MESTNQKLPLLLQYLFREAANNGYKIDHIIDSPIFKSGIHKITDPHSAKEMVILGNNIYADMSYHGKFFAKQKHITQRIMEWHGITVPKSFLFKKENEIGEILQKFGDEERIVVKPENKSWGEDVYFFDDKEKAAETAGMILKKHRKGLIQEFVEGKDLRIQSVGGKLFAACTRVPANVTGDGTRTVLELIESKNSEKVKVNAENAIKLDAELDRMLEKRGYNLGSIPNEGEYLQLKEAANIGQGGDPIDVTEMIHQDYFDFIEKIAGLFGVKSFAADFLVKDETLGMNKGNAHLIEINVPSVWLHHHFAEGRKRNVALALLDHYFAPETFDPKSEKYWIA